MRDRLTIWPAWLLAGAAAGWALYVAWAHAVLHWYADAWYVYPQLMNLSWKKAVLLPENGHRLVVSQMLRWIDLHAFGGNQQLLRTVGVAWVSGVLFLLVSATARAEGPRWLRAQVLLILVLGVAWLGNVRMLSHPYETVHVYLVMLLTMLTAGVLARSVTVPMSGRERVMLGVYGSMAALVFGSGFALLPAVLVVLVLTRARPLEYSAVAAGLIVVSVLFFALPGADDVRGLTVAPVRQFDLALRWIATPVLFLGVPLVDPAVAQTIPFAPAASIASQVAELSRQQLGDVWTSAVPQRLVGTIGVAWLLQASLAAWRGRRPQLAVFGLLLAWFAVGVGVLIALTRTQYFAGQPRQLHAVRYLPWSCLFWSGLAAATLTQYAARLQPVRVAAAVTALAVVLLASNVGGHAWSAEQAAMAAAQSAAALEGREPTAWGETVPSLFHAALPMARERRVGPWADAPATPPPPR